MMDIEILQRRNQDWSAPVDASSRIETVVTNKVFKFQGKTAAIAKATPGRTLGVSINGLAKQTMAYCNITNASHGLPEKDKTEDVPLVENIELIQIQRKMMPRYVRHLL